MSNLSRQRAKLAQNVDRAELQLVMGRLLNSKLFRDAVRRCVLPRFLWRLFGCQL